MLDDPWDLPPFKAAKCEVACHVYDFPTPAGEERSDSWLSDLLRFYCPDRAREILDAPHVAIAARRRALLAEGRARDPGFVLSEESYNAAAAGVWTVRVAEDGRITVDWSRS